jgi:hypothetical protein
MMVDAASLDQRDTSQAADKRPWSPTWRQRGSARLVRLLAWEFWPAWLIYAALTPALLWFALRHRGMRSWLCVNPAIPLGGLVGEPKDQILAKLPAEVVVPGCLLARGDPQTRLATLQRFMAQHGLTWPIILKPNIGERGTGVRLVTDAREALARLDVPYDLIAQAYHSGPFEAGVFYARMPGEPRGRVVSITDKQFASVTGNGTSTLEQLIWAEPRLRLQARVFVHRLGRRARHIPPAGRIIPLGIAGNHCRGTLFRDGSHLWTPQLEAAFDSIAKAAPGIYFGRFDVRYADPAEFRAGRGFAIVELNGVLSEPTHAYDPRTSFWRGQRIFRDHWQLAFAVGAACVKRGARVPSYAAIWRSVAAHVRRPGADEGSD